MKIFTAIVILVACVFAEEWTVKNSQQLRDIRLACIQKHPLSAEQMTKMKDFDLPDEEPVRKYLQCTDEKIGVFSPEQGYHADRIAKQFRMDMEEDQVKKLAEDCIAQYPKGEKAADVAAFEVHGCLIKSAVGEKVKAYIKERRKSAQLQQ